MDEGDGREGRGRGIVMPHHTSITHVYITCTGTCVHVRIHVSRY